MLPFFGNNVVGFGNNVERNFILSTKSKQIEHVFVSTLSKGRNFETAVNTSARSRNMARETSAYMNVSTDSQVSISAQTTAATTAI